MMGRERRQRSEDEEEVGEERMRLKRCHANLGLLVFLNKALVSEAAWSIYLLTLLSQSFWYIWRERNRPIFRLTKNINFSRLSTLSHVFMCPENTKLLYNHQPSDILRSEQM